MTRHLKNPHNFFFIYLIDHTLHFKAFRFYIIFLEGFIQVIIVALLSKNFILI